MVQLYHVAERFESSLDTVLAYRDRGFDSATTFFVFLVLHTGLADPKDRLIRLAQAWLG